MAEAAASAGTFDRLQAALAGRYTLVRELGHGGMATVYLARDAHADREVAIKVLLPELGATLGADRFLREVTLAGSLDHPNIMGMYDSGEADGLLYYVMPYIQGESLRDRLERVRQLSVTEALAITDQVAAALAHAHAQGVIHRDIKPENILLSGDHAIVADFGVARAVTVAGGEKLTQTGMAVGTPTYMSPEQAAGSRDVTPQSDQYSLACTVYEMLAGQPPFTGPTAMSIMARHSLDAVPSLRIVRSAVPDEVEDALFCALEKVPADRFPSVEAFAHALHTPGATPNRRRTERTVTTSVPARRLRRWHVAALAGAAVVVLGAGAWWFMRHRGPAAPSGPDPRQVAVLYFDDQSPDHQLRYLADGLTEALIHELSDVNALHVISRNGVLPYKGTAVTPDSIARALHVGTLVEGSVAASDSLLRVSVSLVNPRTGAEIASKQLERPRKELFALQDDIAKEVSIFLRRQLGQEVQLRGARAGTGDIAAWEAFQRGEQALRDADTLSATGDTKAADGAFLQADSLFAVAQNRDHRWGAPLVQRGWISYKRWRLAGVFDKAAYGERFPEGIRFATQALALNRSDADALELEGTLRYWRWLLNLAPDGDSARLLLDSAEANLRASVAADSNQAQAWGTLSHLLLAKSQTAEGKLAAQRAYEADPYLTNANLVLWRLFSSSLDLGDGPEASKWCTEGGSRFPQDPRFRECKIWLFALKTTPPNIAEAWRLENEYEQLSPPALRPFRHLRGRMLVALALARAGLADSARSVAAGAAGDPQIDPTRELAFLGALVYIILDDRDQAITLLSTFLASNPQQRASMARDQSWWFSSIRTDPRYRAMVGSGS